MEDNEFIQLAADKSRLREVMSDSFCSSAEATEKVLGAEEFFWKK
uniref:Uncharacterized protein n=1 Tax=Anguilla anguilla TaxID=7936 RepID=A0A0E9UFY5_ANGAN